MFNLVRHTVVSVLPRNDYYGALYIWEESGKIIL